MSTEVKHTVFIFALAHILTVAIFYCITIFDLIYIYPVASGNSANILYTFAWWFLAVFLAINYIFPLILLSVVVDEKNQSRVDIHSITATIFLCVNFLVFIGCILVYFLYTNTSYSGNFPFNDPRWCCSFYIDHPELCPNTSPCLPDANPPLSRGVELIVIWVFSGVFIILGFIHLGLNRLLRISGAIASPSEGEARLLGIIVCFVYLAIYAYWLAWPTFDLQYINGYPTLGIPPGPGTFQSTLYNWQWVLMCIALLANIFPPNVSLACFISENKSYSITSLHFWTNLISGIISGVICLILLGIWIGDCNWVWSGESICRSDLFCCVFFSNYPDLCGNTTPCDAILRANSQYIQHTVITGILAILSFVFVWYNVRFVKYGVFK